MKKYSQNCYPPPKRKPRKKCENNKLGIMMILLGIVTLMALFLPLKCWVLLLSGAMVIFGILLLKK